MKIAVVGMGKIGLPLAAQYASKGHTVVGVDVNPATVSTINAAEEPFPGEFGLAEALKKYVPSSLLRATISYEEAIPTADVIVVVVPLFVDEDDRPDFGWMDSATTSIGQNLTKDTLVIYETTLPIGTTRNRWKPMLEGLSGLHEGTGFHLAFSPERVLTGRVFEDLKKYPKLVGGLSEAGTQLACDFYEAVLDFNDRDDLSKPNGVWDLGSAEAAEMAKLAETTYRDVNIALANQFALHAEEVGVDVYKVIEACNSQPYSHIHQPGISVGGHCIPVYPRLYLHTDRNGLVVREARAINRSMPQWATKLVATEHHPSLGNQVLILGVSYRFGVKESAYSGALELKTQLHAMGYKVVGHDRLFTVEELGAMGFDPPVENPLVDIVIAHSTDPSLKMMGVVDFPNARLVIDGRNSLNKANWAGTRFFCLGKPGLPTVD